jgi:hypothetical protein
MSRGVLSGLLRKLCFTVAICSFSNRSASVGGISLLYNLEDSKVIAIVCSSFLFSLVSCNIFYFFWKHTPKRPASGLVVLDIFCFVLFCLRLQSLSMLFSNLILRGKEEGKKWLGRDIGAI